MKGLQAGQKVKDGSPVIPHNGQEAVLFRSAAVGVRHVDVRKRMTACARVTGRPFSSTGFRYRLARVMSAVLPAASPRAANDHSADLVDGPGATDIAEASADAAVLDGLDWPFLRTAPSVDHGSMMP